MADSGDPSGQHMPPPGGSGRGLLTGRRPSATISPGRLPAMRSRDLTLGGVKKVKHYCKLLVQWFKNTVSNSSAKKYTLSGWYTIHFLKPIILNRCFCVLFCRKLLHPTLLDGKSKRSEFIIDVEGQNRREEIDFSVYWLITLSGRTKIDGGPRRGSKDGDRGRGPRDRGRGRGRPEVIQSHSIFEQGPAEMMMKKKGSELSCITTSSPLLTPLNIFAPLCIILSSWFKWIPVSYTGGYEAQSDAPIMGPTPIINIKKEKRETEEETKEILRSLERDNVSPTVPPQ